MSWQTSTEQMGPRFQTKTEIWKATSKRKLVLAHKVLSRPALGSDPRAPCLLANTELTPG
jgi:hypothetical protein